VDDAQSEDGVPPDLDTADPGDAQPPKRRRARHRSVPLTEEALAALRRQVGIIGEPPRS